MAEKNRFPQIPSTVWWGVRSLLQKTPKMVIDERALGVTLGVQPAAARQYISELKAVGILDDDCKATDLASRWRLDDSYADSVDRILAKVYPEGLIHLSHPGEGNRQAVVSWFEREGLGRGAAGNKAATYFLIGSGIPNESPGKSSARSKSASPKSEKKTKPAQVKAKPSKTALSSNEQRSAAGSISHHGIPLNVNVQIHISADAGVEQIDAIFSAMKRYLSNNESD